MARLDEVGMSVSAPKPAGVMATVFPNFIQPALLVTFALPYGVVLYQICAESPDVIFALTLVIVILFKA